MTGPGSDNQTSPAPVPRYATTQILTCPDCYSDLADEAFAYWCPGCQRAVSFAEAISYIDGDPHD